VSFTGMTRRLTGGVGVAHLGGDEPQQVGVGLRRGQALVVLLREDQAGAATMRGILSSSSRR